MFIINRRHKSSVSLKPYLLHCLLIKNKINYFKYLKIAAYQKYLVETIDIQTQAVNNPNLEWNLGGNGLVKCNRGMLHLFCSKQNIDLRHNKNME